MAKIVVLGAGIGGISAAYQLRTNLGKAADIRVVSDSEWFQFTPSNPWVALNWRKPADIKVHLPEVLERFGIAFDASGARHLVPSENRVLLNNGRSIGYDYLVIATGPALAFDEIEGLGPEANSISICHVDHATEAAERWKQFCADPGPMVVGAVQGASCFGPAYKFALLANADLRRRKIRDRVPITLVTSEPYIGHLGLGGVGDTKGLLESMLRDRDIRWITNTKVDRVGPEVVEVTEVAEDGEIKRQHRLPSKLAMFIPAFRGVSGMTGEDGKPIAGLVNPRGFVLIDKYQRNPTFRNVFAVGVCVAIPPYRADAGSGRRTQDRLYDRIDGLGRCQEHPRVDRRQRAGTRADLECRLSRGFWRCRRRLCRVAANPAPQCQLGSSGLLGACRQGRFREILPAQGAQRAQRARL